MVAYYVSKTGTSEEYPNIFAAAAADDVVQMALCIQRGERLDDIDPATSFTPIHIAIIEGSDGFLQAAMGHDFNPWIRDINDRLPIDHAAAIGLQEVHKALHQKMYPSGWSKHLTPE